MLRGFSRFVDGIRGCGSLHSFALAGGDAKNGENKQRFMDPKSKKIIIDNYDLLLKKHGSGPAVSQWSPEGQLFRFQKLAEIGDLSGARVLDVGCGLGDFYTFLKQKFGSVNYTGIDIVDGLIHQARRLHPDARFECLDLTEEKLEERFDYVLISGIFNNHIPDSDSFIRSMASVAYGVCDKAMGFNFISSHVSTRDKAMAYHDPAQVFDFCVRELSLKVHLFHCYERRDAAIFVYRL